MMHSWYWAKDWMLIDEYVHREIDVLYCSRTPRIHKFEFDNYLDWLESHVTYKEACDA